jgi:membrane protein YdbS with pleckstrin-like domain
MPYVTRVLLPGEAVVYMTKLHWVIYWRAFVLLFIAIGLGVAAWYTIDNQNLNLGLRIAAVIFALMALWSALRAFIRRATMELAVTDQRVIHKTGLLSRHTHEMSRMRVQYVSIHQTLLGRIFGYGTVVVHGTGSSFDPIRNVSGPHAFRSYLTIS